MLFFDLRPLPVAVVAQSQGVRGREVTSGTRASCPHAEAQPRPKSDNQVDGKAQPFRTSGGRAAVALMSFSSQNTIIFDNVSSFTARYSG